MSTTPTPQEAGALPADALILAYNNAVWALAQYYTRPGFESAQALAYEAKVTEAHVAIREALAAARREGEAAQRKTILSIIEGFEDWGPRRLLLANAFRAEFAAQDRSLPSPPPGATDD